MYGSNCPTVLAGIIFVPLVLSSFEAQSAVDGKSCSSYGLAEVTRLIKEEFSDVKNLIMANQLSTVEASKRALVSALVREYTDSTRISCFCTLHDIGLIDSTMR